MRNKNYKVIMLGLALQIGVCFGLVFGASNEVLAYTASITTNNNVTMDVSPASGGVSIQTESINVVSDCRNGYNLSIATPAGSDLYRYDNGTQASTASFTAVDGTSALSSDNNINKWGYTLADNPTGSMVFSPLSATSVALKTSTETASPSSDINDTFNINYGVKVDNSIAPGSYQMANQGAIVYYLTMDTACTQYMVSFNANGGTGTMVDQPLQEGEPDKINPVDFVAPAGASYTDADNNTITGDADKLWLFWGWNTRADGTGDWYKDNEEVLNISSVGSTAIFYAQWRQATLSDMTAGTPTGTEKVINHNLMQDMRPEICYNSDITTAANAPAATLLDYRGKVTTGDNPEAPEQYTVSKLPDGLCWMTTNLNLGRNDSAGPNNNGAIKLTSEDSDLPADTTFTLPKSTTTSSTSATAARIRTTNSSGNNNNGTYYSWAAAVASTVSTTSSPITSICPKNWDLPSNDQYSNLASKSSYSSSNSPMNAPSSFLAGRFTNGASFYPTSYDYGFYWSNTSNSSSLAYGARVTTSALTTNASTGTTYGGDKYYEKNVRCIASQGTVTVYYDGNGTAEYPVTGSVAPQENVEINSSSVQSGDGLSRAGWAFTGWNTAPDGSGTTVAVGASFSALLKPSEVVTLYAQWTPQYTITYINNCMSWASSDTNCTATTSATTSTQKINLNASGNGSGTLEAYNKFILTGWKIKEWTTNADGTGTAYPVSSTYRVTGAGAGDGITLYAHWVPTYTVQYDGNGSDNDSTGMGSTNATTGIKSVAHTNVGEGDTFDLFASNFKKAGYGFVGWSTDANAWSKLTDDDTTNDAKIWGPNEIITAPAYNGTPITILYAIWAPAETSGGNPVYLQGWTGCSAMTATTYDDTTGTLTVAKDSVTALTDQRDGEVYTIAKLADENCWMVENLRLADTHQESGNTVATVLTTSNTNILDSNSTLPITNIYNADPSLATTSNSLSPSSSVAYNASSAPYGWCTTKSTACLNQSRLNTTNTVANITPSQTQNITSVNAHTNFNKTIYAYGNYYDWYSATAGYGTYPTVSDFTDGDLCPVGWHLPYGNTSTGTKGGNTSGGFYYLANRMTAATNSAVNSNKFRTFPNNFIYAGYWVGNSGKVRGGEGSYWSNRSASNIGAFNLYLSSTLFYPGNTNVNVNKYNGSSVRCVASPAP